MTKWDAEVKMQHRVWKMEFEDSSMASEIGGEVVG